MKKRGKNKSIVFWAAELKSSKKHPKLSKKHSNYRWVNKDEALSMYKMLNELDDKIEKHLFA